MINFQEFLVCGALRKKNQRHTTSINIYLRSKRALDKIGYNFIAKKEYWSLIALDFEATIGIFRSYLLTMSKSLRSSYVL
jgi:hypothetical protein